MDPSLKLPAAQLEMQMLDPTEEWSEEAQATQLEDAAAPVKHV